MSWLRIKTLTKRNIDNHNNKKSSENARDKITWFTILYTESISEKFKNIINNSVVKLSYFSLNKLCTMIKTHKDLISAWKRM